MISLIILNYFSDSKTIRLLESLKNQIQSNLVILVDNGSENDEAKRYLESNFRSYKYLKPNINLGFSGGVNYGIKEAINSGSNWFVLINNDTNVPPTFITELSEELFKIEGIAGLPILEDAGKVVSWGEIRWLRHTLSHQYEKVKPTEYSYANGGAMAIHKSVIDKIGLFDEKYFMYFEDADFSFRARKKNIPIYFLNISPISHEVSGSSKKVGSPLLLRIHYRNALYFNHKNGPLIIKMALHIWALFIIVKQGLKILMSIKKEESLAIIYGVLDFYKGRMGKVW